MILVDTSAWIEFLKRPESAVGRELAQMLRANQVVMVGVVLAEVLQSTQGEQFATISDRLEALPYLDADRSSWIKAAELASYLRNNGQTTVLSDLLIAAIAMEHDLEVFATDRDFRRVPGLKLHEPA